MRTTVRSDVRAMSCMLDNICTTHFHTLYNCLFIVLQNITHLDLTELFFHFVLEDDEDDEIRVEELGDEDEEDDDEEDEEENLIDEAFIAVSTILLM